ncbi:hypothetical protein HOA55_05240 [archaeon]|jgi:hypothetical protein|nr:hypothetical protein [archaeon]MBT3577726.1 hypothetical protein [archaeon]MBT6820733.1 hypothetical protein [archaeon]MBT6955895.1 hypothetical protein [archaeon]MBT7025873.1 hypothetical protein [archaeon]
MITQQITISIIILIAAIPLGLFLKYLTDDEKEIYKKYFPVILWVLAIAAAVFYNLNVPIALTFTATFITLFVWNWK